VRQVSDEKDVEVRARRTAETLLNMLHDRGKRKLPLDAVYRPLEHPAMDLRAYAKLYKNPGARPPGITEETVEGRATAKMPQIIEAIRPEKWPWTPRRRLLTEKLKGGKRPLGRPIWSDQVGQDLGRSLLEADYAPPCSTHRHGFSPPRGGQTALTELPNVWVGPTGFIEGDIKGGFEHIAHPILLHILQETIQAHRFRHLLAGALQAGYGDAWTSHPSLSGSPQGGIGSPLLSHSSRDS
jgi:retron-type reverse transcriptase